MVDFSCFERAIQALQDSVRRYLTLASQEDLERWLSSVNDGITALENIVRNRVLSNAEARKSQTCTTLFMALRQRLAQRIQVLQQPQVGGELHHAYQQPREELQPPPPPPQHSSVSWDYFESAFANRLRSGVISNLGHSDIKSFMSEAKVVFEEKIGEVLREHSSLKVNTDLAAEFSVTKNDENITEVKYFQTQNGAIYVSTNLSEWFVENIQRPIERDLEDFQQTGSGWTLNFILRLVININKFNGLRAGSYIDLPAKIKSKQAIINVKNEADHMCFKWAILSALHPLRNNSNDIKSYQKFEKELDFTGIPFPVTLKDVPKFERLNAISVNVYILKKNGENFRVNPCHLTGAKRERHVNLLLIQEFYIDEEEEEEDEFTDFDNDFFNFHYVWIKNMSALIAREKSKNGHKLYVCDSCMNYKYSQKDLDAHEIKCREVNKCRITLPSQKEKLKFKNNNNKERAGFIVYADFECLLEPVEDKKIYQRHEAFAIGFMVWCSFDPSQSRYESYIKTDDSQQSPADWFVEKLVEVKDQVEAAYGEIKPMNLTVDQLRQFSKAKKCHICNEPFRKDDVRVRDHDHKTGE